MTKITSSKRTLGYCHSDHMDSRPYECGEGSGYEG